MDWKEVEKVVQFWEKLDLIKFRSNYDKKGLDIEAIREDAQKNRKKLSKETRDFRKLEESVKLRKFGSLVKSYQQEINNLTERGRKSEQNFLEILNYLREVQDPTPVLKKVIDNEKKFEVSELVKKNEEMTNELSQYKKEFKEIKNQEVTIRHLENQLQYLVEQQEKKKLLGPDPTENPNTNHSNLLTSEGDKENDEKAGEDDEEDELTFDVTSLLANFQDQIDGLKNKNYELEKMVEHHKGLYTQTESKLRSLSLELSRSQQSHQQELEFVRSDIAKYQMEEKMHSQERQKLREYQNQENHYLHIEREVKEKEREILALTKKLTRAESAIQERENKVNELTESSKMKDDQISELRMELNTLPKKEEFEEIKKRLEMMEKIEFGDLQASTTTTNNNDEEEVDEKNQAKNDSEDKKSSSNPSIEILLNRKIRKQEHEFTNLKNELSEKVLENAKYELEVRSLKQKVLSQASLIENMESDLMNIQNDEFQQENMSEVGGGDEENNNNQSLLSVDQSSSASFFSQSALSSSSSSILNAVIQQRNRLKKKNEGLRDQVSKVEEKSKIQNAEIKRLQGDNIKMYEKIRYIESYSQHNMSPTTSASADGNNKMETYRDQGGDTVVTMNRRNGNFEQNTDGETRYRKLYEDKLNASLVENPFNSFSKKERREQFQKLTFAERLTLITTGNMLRHKSGRIFLFIYTFSLHLLVFLMCYYVVRRC